MKESTGRFSSCCSCWYLLVTDVLIFPTPHPHPPQLSLEFLFCGCCDCLNHITICRPAFYSGASSWDRVLSEGTGLLPLWSRSQRGFSVKTKCSVSMNCWTFRSQFECDDTCGYICIFISQSMIMKSLDCILQNQGSSPTVHNRMTLLLRIQGILFGLLNHWEPNLVCWVHYHELGCPLKKHWIAT